MENLLSRILNDFDRGAITRRQLMQALGVAAATPLIGFTQGSCGGDNAGQGRCNKTPLKDPFPATGWKTVLLDNFSIQLAELDKEAAYYKALMGWKVRSNDGQKIVMDIGNVAGVTFRGGLPLPPPAPMTQQTPLSGLAAQAQALANTASQLAAAEARGANSGRGGGRGAAGGGAPGGVVGAANAPRGGGGGGQRGLPQNLRCRVTGFCFGIEPWNTASVEAELKKRGLSPVADHNAKEEFYSFHVKDPDGWDLQISNGNSKNRRTTPANAELNMAQPFEPTGWETLYVDHISFQVSSYKESVAFYKALMGWIPGGDEGSQDQTRIAVSIGSAIIRGGNSMAPDFVMRSPRFAYADHIAFGIKAFDPDKVQEALLSRGLTARVDTGGRGDIHTAAYKSYHTTTPNGYDLQISNVINYDMLG